MGWDEVLMRLTSSLARDNVDGWSTWWPSWLSVPLTVDSILRFGSCFVLLIALAFVFATLMLRSCRSLVDYSVGLRITTLAVLVIVFEVLVRSSTYWSNVQDLTRSPEREEWSTRWSIWCWFIYSQTMNCIRLTTLHKNMNWYTNK